MKTEEMKSDEDDTEGLWWVGVLMSLGASFGTVVGMTLQKIGHQRNKQRPPGERRSCWTSPFTWMGLVLMIVLPAPLDVGALAFAKYSVLAPFSGFTLVLNAIVAPRCLGERVQLTDYLGAALICFGTSITTMFGSHASRSYDVDALTSIYLSTKTLAYTIVGGLFTLFVVIAVWSIFRRQSQNARRRGSFNRGNATSRSHSKEKKDSDDGVEMQRLLESGSSGAVANDTPHAEDLSPTAKTRKRSISGHLDYERSRWCSLCGPIERRMAGSGALWLAYVNGVAGSTQQVCVKTLVELLKTSTTAGKENQFEYPLTYFIGFVAGVTALVQFRVLNFGLERYNQIFYVPLYSAMMILTGILGGWFYLDDAEDLTWSGLLMFVLGGVVTIAGVFTLQMRRAEGPDGGGAAEDRTSYDECRHDDEGAFDSPGTHVGAS